MSSSIVIDTSNLFFLFFEKKVTADTLNKIKTNINAKIYENIQIKAALTIERERTHIIKTKGIKYKI